ncbi:hypothetical protein COLO4_00911 [Corchorus olitorius]|uniref:Uncharacterized protein n=1 Tax=Corchorus olitorius TaxID=93759 RepID=A0A1R3L3C8_9ROSI|nr:hypothetical protein COLO4_00911 [Corchorus olitorius]
MPAATPNRESKLKSEERSNPSENYTVGIAFSFLLAFRVSQCERKLHSESLLAHLVSPAILFLPSQALG